MGEMNRRRAALQGYLAGIIDGEGSFGIYEINGSYSGRLVINMTDPEAVMIMKRLYPEGTFSVLPRQGKNTYWVTYSNNRVYDPVKDLIPFLIIKQRQAKIVLSYTVHKRRAPGTHGLDCRDCRYFATALRAVRAEIKEVNSVNALLSHGLREYRAKQEDVEADVMYMRGLLEGVETRVMPSTGYKPMSASEQDIVLASR